MHSPRGPTPQGNFATPVSDYLGVGCEHYREALSARLDGETGPVAPAELDAHLGGCGDCRRWVDAAAAATRLVRTGVAPPAVDVTDEVLPAAPGRWRGRVVVALRVALGMLGTAQLLLGLLQLTTLRPVSDPHLHGTMVDGATAGHLWHESAAWNLAVGAGFLWVAARRGRPVGIIPILTVFVAALVVLSAADIWAGRVESTRLASHAFVLTGYLIVLALCRRSLDLLPPRHRAAGGRHPAGFTDPAPITEPGGGTVIQFPATGQGQPAARAWQQEAA